MLLGPPPENRGPKAHRAFVERYIVLALVRSEIHAAVIPSEPHPRAGQATKTMS